MKMKREYYGVICQSIIQIWLHSYCIRAWKERAIKIENCTENTQSIALSTVAMNKLWGRFFSPLNFYSTICRSCMQTVASKRNCIHSMPLKCQNLFLAGNYCCSTANPFGIWHSSALAALIAFNFHPNCLELGFVHVHAKPFHSIAKF